MQVVWFIVELNLKVVQLGVWVVSAVMGTRVQARVFVTLLINNCTSNSYSVLDCLDARFSCEPS